MSQRNKNFKNNLLKNLIFFNMGFFDEFVNLFQDEEIDQSFRVVVLGKTALMVEGYKKVVSLKEDEIVLSLEKGQIKVKGVKLYIKRMEKGEAVISGSLLSFELV